MIPMQGRENCSTSEFYLQTPRLLYCGLIFGSPLGMEVVKQKRSSLDGVSAYFIVYLRCASWPSTLQH